MADNPFVICQYFNFGMWNFFLSMFHVGDSSVVASSAALKESIDTLWKAQLSVLVMLVLESFHNRLQALGEIVEKYLNFIDVNGGLSNIIYMILTGTGNDIISAPKPGSSNYLSAIGQLDWRTQLDRTIAIQHGGREIGGINHKFFPDNSVPEPVLMAELCIMSSKLAYENPETVKGIVTGTWNMNFVAQYNCWIAYIMDKLKYLPWKPTEPQRVDATKVFLATDRQEEARVIVVAFRGTDPFNTFNWITDFDFSWYNLKNLGRVHVGFLEALGLGSRDNLETFAELQRRLLDPASPGSSMSGLPGDVTSTKLLAYDVVTQKLKELIQTHKDAKIYVTGHSLGGALACLYSALLYYAEEFELADRIGGVFTFGQPRVGDYEFVSFYNGKLTQPVNRYFRVVYNNDVVPRFPFDDSISGFEHAGICRYFDSFYNGMLLAEVPNKNYFSIFYYLPMTISAIWELLYNTLILPFLHGHDYLETKISTLFRTVGVLFPGIGSHSPVSYVNSVRLGTSSENLW